MAAHTAAYDRFMASMDIGFFEGHDGTPYDLEALSSVTADEVERLESLLIERKNVDWRDAEALARIQSPKAILALEESLVGPNREVRLRAAELLHQMGRLDHLEEVIVEGLRFGELGEGLAQAERLAALHPSCAVKKALIQGALCSQDRRAVRFVGILFFLYGKAVQPFDGAKRFFFMRFGTTDRRERRMAFDEMCQIIGIDGSEVRCSPE